MRHGGRTPKVAVIGSVGIPARYGGFETLAEQLVRETSPEEMALYVYCEAATYRHEAASCGAPGHRRIFMPLRANGVSSMLYDMLSVAHALTVLRADCLLVLGCSGALALPAVRVLSPRTRIVTNIDGMEWRRAKWSRAPRLLLQFLERCSVAASHVVVADNAEIAHMATARYGIEPVIIAYGGDHTLVSPSERVRPTVPPIGEFYLSIARAEPENNCHLILEAFAVSRERVVFFGNWSANAYGRALRAKFARCEAVDLRDPVYDVRELAWYRGAAKGYVHGHSVGGTNPSLVEALFWTNNLFAFECPFNRATLGGEGRYFDSAEALSAALASGCSTVSASVLAHLKRQYRWRTVANAYMRLMRGAGESRGGRCRS